MLGYEGKDQEELFEGTVGYSSNIPGAKDSQNQKKEEPDLFSELAHNSISPKGVHLRAAPTSSLKTEKESRSSSDGTLGSVGKEQRSRLSVGEVLKLSKKRRVTFGELLQELDMLLRRPKESFLRVVSINSIKEMDFETQTLASGSLNFLLEEGKLDGVLSRLDRFRKGIRVTRSMKSCASRIGAQDMTILLDDEKDLGSYVVCIEVPEDWSDGAETR